MTTKILSKRGQYISPYLFCITSPVFNVHCSNHATQFMQGSKCRCLSKESKQNPSQIDIVLKAFENAGTTYLSRKQFQNLHQEIDLIQENNIDWKGLLRNSRMIYNRIRFSREDRKKIREELKHEINFGSTSKSNVTSLCQSLVKKYSLPYSLVYWIVYHMMYHNLIAKRISKIPILARNKIAQYVHHVYSSTDDIQLNVSKIVHCVKESFELEQDPSIRSVLLQIPHPILYRIVSMEFQKVVRKNMSIQEKKIISTIVKENPNIDIRELCSKVKLEVNLPRVTIYQEIRRIQDLHSRIPILQKHREIVRQYILQNLEISYPELCNALDLPIPRKQVYALVQSERLKIERMKTDAEWKQKVRDYCASCNVLPSDKEICDKLQNEIPISRSHLYRLVRTETQSILKRQFSQQQKTEILRYLGEFLQKENYSSSLSDVDNQSKLNDLCFRVQSKLNLPFNAVKVFLTKELEKQVRRKILLSDTLKSQIVKSIQESNEISIIQLRDEIKSSFAQNIPKGQLYKVILQEVGKIQRRKISRNDREFVKKVVFKTLDGRSNEKLMNLSSSNEEAMTENSIEVVDSIASFIADKLNQFVSIPRRELLAMIHQDIHKYYRKFVTIELKTHIQRLIQIQLKTNAIRDISRLCDIIQPQVSIPRSHLCSIIHNEVSKISLKEVSKEHRQLIRDFLGKKGANISTKDTKKLCDEFQDIMPVLEIPRRSLYIIIRNELRKLHTR